MIGKYLICVDEGLRKQFWKKMMIVRNGIYQNVEEQVEYFLEKIEKFVP